MLTKTLVINTYYIIETYYCVTIPNYIFYIFQGKSIMFELNVPNTFFIEYLLWFSENFRRTLDANCETWDFLENDLLKDERLIEEVLFFPLDILSNDFNSSYSGFCIGTVVECCEIAFEEFINVELWEEADDLTEFSDSSENYEVQFWDSS